jgi:excisionase family DNA binding protein
MISWSVSLFTIALFLSKSTVLQWIKDNDLKAFQLPGGHFRIDKEDFRNFIEKWNIPIQGWPFEETKVK